MATLHLVQVLKHMMRGISKVKPTLGNSVSTFCKDLKKKKEAEKPAAPASQNVRSRVGCSPALFVPCPATAWEHRQLQ